MIVIQKYGVLDSGGTHFARRSDESAGFIDVTPVSELPQASSRLTVPTAYSSTVTVSTNLQRVNDTLKQQKGRRQYE